MVMARSRGRNMRGAAIIGLAWDVPGPTALQSARRRYIVRILSLACVGLAAAAAAQAGTVSGRVDLLEKGGRKGDASEVVVYLEGARAKPRPEPATVAMKGKEFVPRVVVVPVGSTVSFP